jgi:hypothetical protein
MTNLALTRERSAHGGAGLESVAESAPSVEETVTSALDQMVTYVPSEVIGIYIAGVGIIGPISGRGKWGLLGLSLALIPLFIWLSDRIARRSDPGLPNATRKLAWVCLFAVSAFLAWSAALPQTPFLDFSGRATQLGSFAAVVLAAIMPKLAAAVGVGPRP